MQVKKQEVRDAILDAAFALFSVQGYDATTVPQIAARAGVSTTNCYIYFDSKLAILYAIYGPWIQARFEELALELARIDEPRERLRRLLVALFRDLPAREGGFANNIIQAIATVRPTDHYRPALMNWLEDRLLEMLVSALPHVPRDKLQAAGLTHFLMMAFDGHIVFHHIAPERGCDDRTIEFLCDLFAANVSSTAARSRGACKPRPFVGKESWSEQNPHSARELTGPAGRSREPR